MAPETADALQFKKNTISLASAKHSEHNQTEKHDAKHDAMQNTYVENCTAKSDNNTDINVSNVSNVSDRLKATPISFN